MLRIILKLATFIDKPVFWRCMCKQCLTRTIANILFSTPEMALEYPPMQRMHTCRDNKEVTRA